jgi:hypothetical protein
MSIPKIRSDLLRHPLDEQVLVYDSRVDRVHLLDSSTAHVMELIERGISDRETLEAEVAKRVESDTAADVVALAISELNESGLFESEVAVGVSRRDVVRKLAAAGVAGVLVPTIATLTASRAYAQGTLLGVGSACTTNGQCQSNRCCGGTCRSAACSTGGVACGTGVNPGQGETVVDCTCCSGTCTQTGASESSQKCT